jgi:hypothetical protein
MAIRGEVYHSRALSRASSPRVAAARGYAFDFPGPAIISVKQEDILLRALLTTTTGRLLAAHHPTLRAL